MSQKNIPVLDLAAGIAPLKQEITRAIEAVIQEGTFINGPQVKSFEHLVCQYAGVQHAVGMNSGTDAIVIGLRALGIGPGDEVITSPFTFFATAEGINNAGAEVVFVDIDPATFNIDPTKIEAAITSRTKAIMPVHMFGQPCNMDAIGAIAKKHGLMIIEDAAQAFGAQYKGKKVGNLGHAAALSFFPSKNLGAFGDAGMLLTNDAKVEETARMLGTHGSKKKYFNEVLGYNSRLDSIQAAVLAVKLPHLDRAIQGRRQVAQRYHEILESINMVERPHVKDWSEHSFHQYTIKVPQQYRDSLKSRLDKNFNIQTMVYYPVSVNKLPIYANAYQPMPVAEKVSGEVLSLPIWPEIDRGTQDFIGNAIREVLEELTQG